MDEPYVGISEMAKYFKVSVSTVRSWVRRGVLPNNTYLKIGKTYRFRKQGVEAALHKQQLDEAVAAAKTAPSPDKDV